MIHAAQAWHESQPYTETRKEWANPIRPCGFVAPKSNERLAVIVGSKDCLVLYVIAAPCLPEVLPTCYDDYHHASFSKQHYLGLEEAAGIGVDANAALPAFDKVDILRSWHEKYGQEEPSPETITIAKNWLRGLYSDTLAEGTWEAPNVTASENAEVVFEWWHNHKSLTIYVQDKEVTYIKSWGSDILTEMEDGNASNVADRRALWAWLMG